MAVARMLRDTGMEVIYAGRFNVPDMLVQGAVEQDADVIGISCQSWEYMYYVPKLMGPLRERGLDIPVVVGGSVVTPDEERWSGGKRVRAVFGPGSTSGQIVESLLNLTKGTEPRRTS